MKKSGADIALLTPIADGWRLRLAGSASQIVKTLEEAVVAIPPEHHIHLALPGNFVVLERLTLPATDREELEGMVQLQLEKTLPYPLDEASSDFEIIRQTETESTLLSVAANAGQLSELCEPMRSRERLPEKITLFAMHVAAACPADEIVLCIWPEEGQLQVAICEHGKLGFAQTFPGIDGEALVVELPQLLLGAEMEGVPTDFARIWLEQGCAALREPLEDSLGKPVEIISFDAAFPEPAGNLAPPTWKSELRRLAKAGRLRQQLQIAAVLYLLLIAAAFIYLVWLNKRVQKIDAQLAAEQPQIEAVQAKQARWNALAPAIDPSRCTVETLFLAFTSLPSPEVKITIFEHNLAGFRVEGEAPSANLAIDFLEKLRAEKGLGAYRIDSPQPSILPSGAAHFNIFGKL